MKIRLSRFSAALFLAGAACSLLPALVRAQPSAAAQPPAASSSPALPFTYYPEDQRGEFSASLNGTWKFALSPADPECVQPSFDDSAWKPIQVAGNWELQGFEDPLYRNPGDKEGVYRRTFAVPDAWAGRRYFLRFEGVAFAFDFFIDGKLVGSFASAFNRSEFDVTDFVEPGRRCVLAVRVKRREKGWEFDTNDDWAISGIHRDVVLFSLPDVHVKDYTVTTRVSGDGTQASVQVKAWLEDFSKKAGQAMLNARVIDAKGATVGSLTKPVSLADAGTGAVEGNMPIAAPQLWTAETPALYRLNLELLVDGKPVHLITQRVGLRATTIEGGVFKLNGKPVKFRGITHHDMHPETARAMTREQYAQDLELMKAANINAVRMSHYPPQKVFLDLCDEYGMYVLDEVPFGFGEKNLSDDSYEGILALRAKATVARDKNHASVLVWTIGNENPYTPLVVRTAGLVKALDPSRSRSVPHPTGKYYFQPPEEIDLVSPHYLVTRPKEGPARPNRVYLEDILTRTDITAPVLITEYAHAAGTSMEMLKDCWAVMQGSDRFIGGFVWEFQDQGIYRSVPDGTYPGLPKVADGAPIAIGTVKVNTWVAPDRVIDTSGQEGADGVVDSDRIPQSDYWAIQKIYSTVVVPVESLPVKAGKQTLRIPVQNRYDFTDLSSVSGSWELRVDGNRTQGGKLTLRAAPRSETTAEIVVEIPATPETHDQFLRLSFADASKREIAQHTIRLTSGNAPASLYKARVEKPPGGGIKVTEQGAVVTYSAGGSRLQVNKETGDVRFGVDGGTTSVLEGVALRVGRAPQMSEIRAYREAGSAYWTPYLLTAFSVKSVRTAAPAGGRVKADISLQFNRVSSDAARGNVSDQGFIADIHLTFSEQGWLDVDYELVPVNPGDHLLELGLAFKLPKANTRLTWLGKGPYPVYPLQAEGMERGVYSVAPGEDFDTANRAYAGNRTEVDLASASDDSGNGLGVICPSGTISLEPEGDAAFFSHLLRVAGHGEKRALSVAHIKGSELKTVSGSVRLVPLKAGQWPEPFKSVLGNPEVSLRIVKSPPRE
ncbi:MAG: glycoside hydrolase family 2 TIM barrel-domain containing protein [Nibricoccus sp.]